MINSSLLSLFLSMMAGCNDYNLSTKADGPAGTDDESTIEPSNEGAPSLLFLPDPFDFGTVITNCKTSSFDITISNIGSAEVEVLEFEQTNTTSDLSFTLPSLPLILEPGEEVQGIAEYTPTTDGGPTGSISLHSTDPQAFIITRPLIGESCGDKDMDNICDDVDSDRDGDSIANDDDPFPDHITVEDIHIDFDDISPGERVEEQYASLGIHLEGGGEPGEGGDSNIVTIASDCTTAQVETQPNVLHAWVDSGFNNDGIPGLSGWLDSTADVVSIRLYNAGMGYAAESGPDNDMGFLYAYDSTGNFLGSHEASASTNNNEEYVDLQVVGTNMISFELFTGDFDAVDDVHILRLFEPFCTP